MGQEIDEWGWLGMKAGNLTLSLSDSVAGVAGVREVTTGN
jgi:hypothetical protein